MTTVTLQIGLSRINASLASLILKSKWLSSLSKLTNSVMLPKYLNLDTYTVSNVEFSEFLLINYYMHFLKIGNSKSNYKNPFNIINNSRFSSILKPVLPGMYCSEPGPHEVIYVVSVLFCNLTAYNYSRVYQIFLPILWYQYTYVNAIT